jgi:kelch-like protein 20/kelch-like protein 24/35
MPIVSGYLAGFAEVIVCVGGEDDKVVLRSVECFNPATASWSHLKSLPFAVSKAGLVITGDNFMYLCGGEYPDGAATRVSIHLVNRKYN